MDVETPIVKEKSLKMNALEWMDVDMLLVIEMWQSLVLLESTLLLISLIIMDIRKYVKKRNY